LADIILEANYITYQPDGSVIFYDHEYLIKHVIKSFHSVMLKES